MSGRVLLLVLCAAAWSVAWLNPQRDRVAEGNRRFAAEKYDEAITIYGEALVDDPESPLLNFNMGDANYKAGKYTEAVASFSRVRPTTDVPKREVNTAYNIGNTHFRMGAAVENEKPQEALTEYANALVAYRRVLGVDPTHQDAKFNYEFVVKKIDELKKKLEEQQQEEKQQQEQQQQEGDEQQKDEQQKDQQQAGEQQQKEEGQEQQQPQEQPGEQQQQAGAEEAEKNEELSPEEAANLIDAARSDEVQPDEVVRRLQAPAGVAEPAQDW